MPTNPIFIVMLAMMLFLVFSIVLKPVINKVTRDKMKARVIDFYDVNKTKNTENKGENE